MSLFVRNCRRNDAMKLVFALFSHATDQCSVAGKKGTERMRARAQKKKKKMYALSMQDGHLHPGRSKISCPDITSMFSRGIAGHPLLLQQLLQWAQPALQ
mmetsp:Transcript_6171/g.16453  ORF Transcript_6171/g.16453 Transcript_6171/m.16453 type:complete len:100 (-) Transcript_6171:226-525(-)